MRLRLLIIIALQLLVAGPPGEARSRTWFVAADGSGDAPTIQAGVDSSAAGDTVLVGPGTYADVHKTQVGGVARIVNIHIAKSIKLLSQLGPTFTTLDGVDSQVIVHLAGVGSEAEVRGFEFRKAPQGYICFPSREPMPGAVSSTNDAGIWCESSSPVIAGNRFHDLARSVNLVASPATITSNHFEDVLWGVMGDQGSDAVVTGNEFFNSVTGVIFAASSPQIVGNIIRANGGGSMCSGVLCGGDPLSSREACTPLIAGNTIESLVNDGIRCVYLSPTVEGNSVRGCYRLVFDDCGPTSVRRNTVSGTTAGIELTATAATVEENTILDSAIHAVQVSATDIVVRRNIIMGGQDGISCTLSSTINVSCNDVFGLAGTAFLGDCAGQDAVNGNFSADPQFCGTAGSGNLRLQTDSPCAPGNHPDGVDCGRIGAFDVGCSTTSVESRSWGRVKALYRRP